MKKTALITGATSGIGKACALLLNEAGYRVIITGRTANLLNELAVKIGPDCLPLQFDVTDRDAVNKALDSIPEEWRNIDILVNNAGLALGLEPIHDGLVSDWTTMIDTNIKGLLYVTRYIAPMMVERGKGHIVNIGSVAGDAAYTGGGVYCATKAAVKTISDGLRIELVDTPIRVTLIKPGIVETNFSKVRFHGDQERADKVYQGIEALTADDIADTVLYSIQAPAHVQIAEMLVLATYQGNGATIARH